MSTDERVEHVADRVAAVEERTDKLGVRCENVHVRLLKLLPDKPVTNHDALMLERTLFALEHAMDTAESIMCVLEEKLTGMGV